MCRTLPLLALLATSTAWAHPFSKDEYSLYSGVKCSDQGVAVIVILEVPVPVVLSDIQARIARGANKRAAVKDHDQARFDALASGLTLTLDGKPADVTWRPIANDVNGKVSEEFFVYWVGADVPVQAAWGPDVQIVVKNTAMSDVKIVFTGSAIARDGWQVTSNSATDLLGLDVATAERTDARAWSRDEALRTLTVQCKAPGAP